MATELNRTGLTNFIKTARRVGNHIDPAFTVTNDDLTNLRNYLLKYNGILESTASYDDADPASSGIDGSSVVVNKSVLEGRFWNSAASRPKTLEELFVEVYKTLDVTLADSDVATEMLTIKNAVGINKFDASLGSAGNSLDGELSSAVLMIKQIAADCFNREESIGSEIDDASYSLISEGTQTQQSSLVDRINLLLDAHN